MTSSRPPSWHAEIDAGVHAGISDALEAHRRAGREVPVWHDGEVVWLTVEDALAATRAERERRSSVERPSPK